jgi:hypothetical protein
VLWQIPGAGIHARQTKHNCTEGNDRKGELAKMGKEKGLDVT